MLPKPKFLLNTQTSSATNPIVNNNGRQNLFYQNKEKFFSKKHPNNFNLIEVKFLN